MAKQTDNWRWITVGEAGEVRLGRQRSPKNRSSRYPTKYMRAANLKWTGLDTTDVLDMDFKPSELETYRLRMCDVLLSEASGSPDEVGKPVLWRDELPDCCFQNTVIRFRASASVVPEFARTIFEHFARNGLFAGVSKGVGIHHLGADRFSAMPFPLPPLPEQRRIVAKIEELFSDLDAGVAALVRVRANLKRYRAAVLKAAVEGRLTEEWRTRHPTTETAAKLLERILAERRAKWEQDQLRKFKEAGKTPPKGWKEKYEEPTSALTPFPFQLPPSWSWAGSLQLCTGIESGSTPPPDEMHAGSGEVPFIKVYNLTFTGALDFTIKPTFIARETHFGKLNRSRAIPGDVLMNIVGPPLGKVSIVPDLYPEWNTNQAIVSFRAGPGLSNRYLSMCLLADPVLRWITSQAKATAGQHNISVSMSRALPLPLPPLAEQAEIVAEVDRRLSVADAAETQVEHALQRAARLRQAILKRAFEGKLVPQDPTDEPAAALLDRIKTGSNGHRAVIGNKDRAAAKPTKRRSRAHA